MSEKHSLKNPAVGSVIWYNLKIRLMSKNSGSSKIPSV